MDGLALLDEARQAGLTVAVQGDRLIVRGPRRAELLAKRLLDRKVEIIAVLEVGRPDLDSVGGPGCSQCGATRTDRVQGGGIRSEAKGPPDGDGRDLAIRWELDDLDRRVLLQCGILPTPDVGHLSAPWRAEYQRQAARLAKIGVHREHAEAIALRVVLERMLACGDLELPDGW